MMTDFFNETIYANKEQSAALQIKKAPPSLAELLI